MDNDTISRNYFWERTGIDYLKQARQRLTNNNRFHALRSYDYAIDCFIRITGENSLHQSAICERNNMLNN